MYFGMVIFAHPRQLLHIEAASLKLAKSLFHFVVIMEDINRGSLHPLLCRRQIANIERSLAIS
jgi:hypothetical protein